MTALVDLRPLRESPAYRRLWIGSATGALGSQFVGFAAVLAVWRLTESTLAVGLLGLARAVPLVVIAVVGTAFLDHVPHVSVARLATAGQAATTVALAWAAAVGSVGALLALTAVNASCGALGGPARRALVASLVGSGRLGAALALNSLAFQAAMLVGPVLAGALAARTSVAACLLVGAAGCGAGWLGLRGIVDGAPRPQTRRGPAAVLEGLTFATRRPAVRGALLSDLAATVLAMPMALFPAINDERFGGSPVTLGLLGTAVAVGGLSGSVLSGAVTSRSRPGSVMTVCAIGWGAALAVAGVASTLPVVLAALALAGLADTWSVVSRGTLIQSEVPDALRGRVSALEHVVGVGGPELGQARAGAVAAVVGAGPAIVLGGLTCVVASLLVAAGTPELRRWTATARQTPR